jgi:hypothetical protein
VKSKEQCCFFLLRVNRQLSLYTMGIDYDSNLIVGWELDYDSAVKWITENQVGSCDEDYDYICFCGAECQDASKLPSGFEIKASSPYFDCRAEEREVHLTLIRLNTRETETGLAIGDPTADFAGARQLAVRLGAKDAPAKIFSVPNIW